MKLLAFAASHRLDSFNRKLIKLSMAHVAAQGIEVDFAEYGDFDMPIYNDAIADRALLPEYALRFAARAANADGIIISSPEYNWSYPGSLKNIIDWTSCITPNPLSGKTALLMSASPGGRGGIIGLHHLKSPLEAIELTVFAKVFPLGHCREAFDSTGHLIDTKHAKNLLSILDHYVTFTKKLANTL